jgi:tripartite motif-containing protein 71
MLQKDAPYLLYIKLIENSSPADEISTVFQGGRGTSPGQFQFPHGLAIDEEGTIFVADTDNARVQRFLPDGSYSGSICEGICKSPKAVALFGPDILVADSFTKKVYRFSKGGGSPITEFGVPSHGFDAPVDLSVAPEGSIFVADQGRAMIYGLSADGAVISAFGRGGEGDGEFRELTSVTASPSRVYVADARNARIQIFDHAGNFVKKVDVPEWKEPAEGWRAPHVLFEPRSNILYVSCTFSNEVVVLDSEGNRVEKWTGDRTKDLSGPTAMAVYDDKLFVINALGSRVTVLGSRP